MRLETNPEHKIANVSNLEKLKKKVKATIFGTTLALSLFSGSVNVQANTSSEASEQQLEMVSDDLGIPKRYLSDIVDVLEKEDITEDDLKNLKELKKFGFPIYVQDGESLDWMNKCESLENLSVQLSNIEDTSMFQDIKELPNLKSASFETTLQTEYTISEQDFAFLKNSKNLESLNLSCASVEDGFIESLTNLKNLEVSTEMLNVTLDYKKLTFLDSLEFTGDMPYTLAINFSKEDYDTLIANGVNITFEREEMKDKLLEINQELDSIVESLDVTKESSDQEKLDAILIYTLENLTYDEMVLNAPNSELKDELVATFYIGGQLFGTLERDSAICGNYAALVSALANRLELDTKFLISPTHAWNLMEIEGQQYYVDATWLEGEKGTNEVTMQEGNMTVTEYQQIPAEEVIKEGDIEELNWYMADPTEVNTLDTGHDHDVINMPSTITIQPIKEEQVEGLKEMLKEEQPEEEKDITMENQTTEENIITEEQEDDTNKKFSISIGPKTYMVAGGALVGILAGIGGAVAVSKKNQRKRQERLNQQLYDSPDYIDYGDYTNDMSSSGKSTRRR